MLLFFADFQNVNHAATCVSGLDLFLRPRWPLHRGYRVRDILVHIDPKVIADHISGGRRGPIATSPSSLQGSSFQPREPKLEGCPHPRRGRRLLPGGGEGEGGVGRLGPGWCCVLLEQFRLTCYLVQLKSWI